MSLERLECLAAAEQRRHAQRTLTLLQGIAGATVNLEDKNVFSELQNELIRQSRLGLED